MERRFYSLLFEQGLVTPPSYLLIFVLIAILEDGFSKKILITVGINYIVIITMYVGYTESKYRLRIALAHPRDCHFAHVQ